MIFYFIGLICYALYLDMMAIYTNKTDATQALTFTSLASWFLILTTLCWPVVSVACAIGWVYNFRTQRYWMG